MADLPKWVVEHPQTPLHRHMHGRIYEHLLICSGDRRLPVGSSGCCCMRRLRNIVEEGKKKLKTGV